MADDSVIKLKIQGEVFDVDFDDLELGEIGVVEELCDCSVSDIDWESARGIQGLVWIALHRKNDRYTVADAGRVKFSQITDPDAEAEAEGTAKKRPTKAA